MKNIIPNYCSFEQCKLLKEKGFDVPCRNSFSSKDVTTLKIKSVMELSIDFKSYKDESLVNFNKYKGTYWDISRPEQWQVCEWLLILHHIHIQVYPLPNNKWEWCIMFLNEPLPIGFKSAMSQFCVEVSVFDSKQEAYSSAFDYILNNIL